MKKSLFLVFAVFLALVASAVYADDHWVGTLTSTGSSVNNTTTAVPFTLIAGITYGIQCDAAVCVNAGQGNATASSCSANAAGTAIQGGTPFGPLYDTSIVSTAQDAVLGTDHIAIISVTGTANCKVTRLVIP